MDDVLQREGDVYISMMLCENDDGDDDKDTRG